MLQLVADLEGTIERRKETARFELDLGLKSDPFTNWLCQQALEEGRSIIAYKIAHPGYLSEYRRSHPRTAASM